MGNSLLHKQVRLPKARTREYKDPELEKFMNELKSKGAKVTKSKEYGSTVFTVHSIYKGWDDKKYKQYEFTSGEKGVMEYVVSRRFSDGDVEYDWKKVRGWKSEKEFLTEVYVPEEPVQSRGVGSTTSSGTGK